MDDKQKRQSIVLGCLIVFVIGLGIFRVVGAKPSSASPRNTAKVEQQTAKVAGSDPAGNVEVQVAESPAPAQREQYMQEAPVDAGRDPFQPQLVLDPKSVVKQAKSTNASGMTSMRSIPPMVPPMPSISVERSNQGAELRSIVPKVDQSNELSLTGIVDGSTKLAIIRGAGDARFIVREGQVIDGRYRVVYISNRSVWIRYQNKNSVLRLGGNSSSENKTR
jgi:hypothetical protein